MYHKTVYRAFVTDPLIEVFHGYSSMMADEDPCDDEAKVYLIQLPHNLQTEEMLHKIWFALIIRRAINCREVSDANRIHWGRRVK